MREYKALTNFDLVFVHPPEALIVFKPKERKIIIICGLSLLVAVVTFGILGSSGTLKNGGYDLGGAIVGFIVTAYAFNRFYGADPSEIPEGELKGAAFLSEETVKVLDMRNQKPMPSENKWTTPTNRVVLIDHYKLKKLTAESIVKFPYATGGYGMDGACVSHPRLQKWTDKTEDAIEAGEDKHLRKQYEIELDLKQVAKGEIMHVHNAVTYINAFEGKEKDWFHTHVNVPTQSLTIILLFPEAQRCRNIKGLEHIGKNKSVEVDKDKDPIIVDDGKLVYWRIPNPRLGAGYKLEWEWQYMAAPAQAVNL